MTYHRKIRRNGRGVYHQRIETATTSNHALLNGCLVFKTDLTLETRNKHKLRSLLRARHGGGCSLYQRQPLHSSICNLVARRKCVWVWTRSLSKQKNRVKLSIEHYTATSQHSTCRPLGANIRSPRRSAWRPLW